MAVAMGLLAVTSWQRSPRDGWGRKKTLAAHEERRRRGWGVDMSIGRGEKSRWRWRQVDAISWHAHDEEAASGDYDMEENRTTSLAYILRACLLHEIPIATCAAFPFPSWFHDTTPSLLIFPLPPVFEDQRCSPSYFDHVLNDITLSIMGKKFIDKKKSATFHLLAQTLLTTTRRLAPPNVALLSAGGVGERHRRLPFCKGIGFDLLGEFIDQEKSAKFSRWQLINTNSAGQLNIYERKPGIFPHLVRTFASNYSTQASEQRRNENRKDISTIEDPFDAPTYNIPEKPVTFTEGASYSLVILAGLGVAGVAAYAVFKELIFEPKEYKIFGKALERVQNDSRVTVRIGHPVTGYGQESRNRAARQRIPNRVWTDEDGVEHVEVSFHIRGPHGFGQAYAEMFKNQADKKWTFTYLIVEIKSPSPAQLMLESYVPA
ncbi:hypothetical protein ZIOFF_045047 [Zingiber officinale]|uniref:Mitochondrial import inner membrane translocase subunit Tim21 n=1 Tax=Zingiber officinale TaxID=94328 RepID=A0A8J5G360_ZINOF|nr:hypothetical protein ZIOFF_045047 [Zingiber officinale]